VNITGSIDALCRHPVKGLTPEPLAKVTLSRGEYFPGDRLFAIENGPSGFDASAPAHQPKIKFLMLMRNERLARLRTQYDDADGSISVHEDGRLAVRADLTTREGRLALEAFFRRFLPQELRGPPKVLGAPEGFRFTDARDGFVSIINLASVAALEQAVGSPINPRRFRGNIYVQGWPAWGEFDLIGRKLSVGDSVRLKITRRIKRCAATDVDPETGARDLSIPRTLMEKFGHPDCGVYAEVIEGGQISVGDRLSETQAALAF
jgi:uncharacterized protein